MLPLNPYIAGNPIAGEQGFFGREDVLRQVERALSASGQNAVVIFGQRRIGKTSVLLQLQRRLDPGRFVVVYQDLMDKATRPLGEVMRALARAAALELDLPEPSLTFDDEGLNFQHEFLPQAYSALPSPDHHLVLLFDEFDVLDVLQRERLGENVAANQFFKTLRRWILEEPRLEFAFALGRDLKDLDADFLATFKGAQTIRISVLDQEPTFHLITAPTDTIRYTEAAVKRIFNLTNGHPYFTQLLCQLVFDHVYAAPTSGVPLVDEADVDSIVPQAFHVGDNVFAWIWDGLPPAERIVTAALAGLLPDEAATASRKTILEALQDRRVRIITREFEIAPEKLAEWQLLQRANGGYRFFVPLLHRWIRERKPLSQVRDELDRIDPRAQRYYELGKMEFEGDNLEDAIENFERALRVNPEHLQARLAVAEAYLELNQLDAAVEAYEQAYKRDDIQSRAGLVQALLARAEKAAAEDKALADYERVLGVMPGNQIASEQSRAIWKTRAERAFAARRFEQARDAYEKAGDTDGQARADAMLKLADTYAKGTIALQERRTSEAVEHFRQVVSVDPHYKDAAEKLAHTVRIHRLEPEVPEPPATTRMELFRVATFYSWLVTAILAAYLIYAHPWLQLGAFGREIVFCTKHEIIPAISVTIGTLGILVGAIAGFMRFPAVRSTRIFRNPYDTLKLAGLVTVMSPGIIILLFLGTYWLSLLTEYQYFICYNVPATLVINSFAAMSTVKAVLHLRSRRRS